MRLIDANELRTYLNNRSKELHAGTYYTDGIIMNVLTSVYEHIQDMPTIEVKPACQAGWLFEDDVEKTWTTKAICGHCKGVNSWNASLSLLKNQAEYAQEHCYCYMCGAQMVGEKFLSNGEVYHTNEVN